MPLDQIAVPMFLTGNPETELLTSLYAPGSLGKKAWFNQGTPSAPLMCQYQLVKLAGSITTAIGSVLYWSDRDDFVVTTTATNTGQVAGIARIVAAAAEYIWILKKGDREVLFIDSPTVACSAVGLPVVGVTATAGKADSLALATAPQPVLIGRTLGTQDGTTKRASVAVNIDT